MENQAPKPFKPLRAWCVGHGVTIAEVAAYLGVSRNAAKKWELPGVGGRRIPPKHIPALVEMSGGALTAEMLRPDLHAPEDQAA